MKICTWNVFSLKSRFDEVKEFIKLYNIDIMCLQETKLNNDNKLDYQKFNIEGYIELFNNCTIKKGYSGVCIYLKNRFLDSTVFDFSFGEDNKFKNEANKEGRMISININIKGKNLRIINTYNPNSMGMLRKNSVVEPHHEKGLRGLNWRLKYDQLLRNFSLKKIKKQKKDDIFILCGDFNVCRKPRDYWKNVEHLRSSTLTLEEKTSFEKTIKKLNLHETLINHQFTFFSYIRRRKLIKENKGYRLDYILSNKKKLIKTKVIRYGTSDHFPLLGVFKDSFLD